MGSSNSKSGRSKRAARKGADRPSLSTSQQSTADRPPLSTSQQSTSDRPSLATSQQSISTCSKSYIHRHLGYNNICISGKVNI